MPPTYTANLALHKPATGEEAGIWGQTVNTQFDFLDKGIDGNESITLSASSYDLLTSQDVDSIARKKVLNFGGTLGADGSIIIKPNTAQKIYFVTNSTTGGFALNFSQGTGPVFKLFNGRSAIIYSNGLGGSAGVFGTLSDLQVNSLLVQANLIVNGQVQWGAPAVFNQPVTFQGAATFQGLATFQAGATISAPLTINVGSDAAYDLHYRSPGGLLARLGNGTAGQVLTASGSGPSWTAGFQPAINMVVTGSVANRIFFANGSSQMVQDGNLQFVPGMGLGLGMVPQRALSIGRGLSAVIQIDGANSAARGLLFTTDNVARWSLETSTDGEGGSNTGCNFVLRSAADAGSPTLINFASYRSGRTTIGNVYNDGYASQFTVVNTSGSTYIQAWYDSGGTKVASVDNAGNFVSTSSGGFLKLDNNLRLDINGGAAITGHPLGTIHVGKDSVVGPPNPSIAMEGAVGAGTLSLTNVCRLYFKDAPNKRFVIQFFTGGTIYYAWLDLTPDTGGSHSWIITNTAP